jgi:large subunit ribosomal protein L21
MYAVIETGGKQYRVQPGDVVQVEKLEGEVGTTMKFEQVLFAAKEAGDQAQIWLGKPYLSGAVVEGEFVGQGRGEKILIIKYKRRKQYRRTQGHRQYQTQLLITSVANGSGETAKLSAEDKSKKLSTFFTDLTPKGPASVPKTQGSRKRMAEAARAGTAAPKAAGSRTASTKTAAAPKAAAKKAPAKKKAD